MPTYREDLHLGHKVTMTETDDIVNKAITEEKLDDNSVSTRTIQDRAVTEPKLDDDAVSTRTIQDKAVTEPKLDDDAVSTRTIINEAVTEEKMHDNSVSTRTIINESVTETKMHDNSVSTRTIIEHAVTEEKMADNSVSRRTIQEHAINNEKVDDDAIETRNIKDENVTWDKLDANTKNLVATGGGQHGTPFALEFGDSEEIGICQKTLTESRDDLQAQINEIVSDKATVALTVNPAVHFVGDDRVFNFSATSTPTVAQVSFDGGAATNTPATFPVTVSSATPKQETHSALFTVAGINKGAKSATIKLVYPIYYGLLATYNASQLTQYPTAKDKAAGDYTVNVTTVSRKLYFKVPKELVTQITRVSLVSGAFVNEIQGGLNASLGDADYNVWESTDPINVQSDADAGNRTIRVV